MGKKRKIEDGADPAASDDILEITRSKRDVPPADYILKIKSFSQLSSFLVRTGSDKYESCDFEVGGYRWKLALYPKGNAKKSGNDHISLYLALAETNAISVGYQIDATFKFFVYDQIRDKYLTIQDGIVKRYHALKTEHGFDKLLPLTIFNDSVNGYLVDDCCAFGAEVQVHKCTGKGEETISFSKNPTSGSYTWKLERFSELEDDRIYSDLFTAANYKWKLLLYPKGDSREKSRSLSLYVTLDDISYNLGKKVYVDYKLLVKDQVRGWHRERSGSHWFCKSSCSWGCTSFMLLSDLQDEGKGFLVNDTLIIEAKITGVYAVQGLSYK